MFRRSRPPYAKQNHETYVIPGELYSFPSGHSIRAGLLAFWLVYGKNANLFYAKFGCGPPALAATLCWAALVAFSRLGKGRHFPSDVVVGYAIGVAVGYVLEGPAYELTNFWRGVPKVLGGVFITGSWGCLFFVPLIERASGLPSRLITALFFVFYAAMLIFSVPKTEAGWNFGACGHDY